MHAPCEGGQGPCECLASMRAKGIAGEDTKHLILMMLILYEMKYEVSS